MKTPVLTSVPVSATARLAAFAADLRFDMIPAPVVRKTEDLLVDWFGSALAGKGARPVETITRFAARMGGSSGPGAGSSEVAAEVLINRSSNSAYFAAMANAAAAPTRLRANIFLCSCLTVMSRSWLWFSNATSAAAGDLDPSSDCAGVATSPASRRVRTGRSRGKPRRSQD